MKQRPQNQQRRPERRGPESAMRAQSRRQEPRRDARPQHQSAAMMPWEQEQERVRKEQLEYARQQAAQERNSEMRQEAQAPRSEPQQEAQAPRSEPQQQTPAPRSEPQPERRREKQQTPALFGFVGKKAG
jgi:hypothetical protein